MADQYNTLMAKTGELEEELKKTGLWQKDMPAWVQGYDDNGSITKSNFAQWLQFVFVPNHLQKNISLSAPEKKLIVPQAIKYFGDDVNKGKLLQILIEIDSLL